MGLDIRSESRDLSQSFPHSSHFRFCPQVAAVMCAFTWILTLAFFFYERTFPAAHRVPTGRQAAHHKADSLGIARPGFWASWKSDRKYFAASIMAIPACFWILDISQLLQSGAVNTYTSNLADTIRVTRNKSNAAAGYTSAIGQGSQYLRLTRYALS